MSAKGAGLLGGGGCALKRMVVMDAPLCGSNKSHWIVGSKWMGYISTKLGEGGKGREGKQTQAGGPGGWSQGGWADPVQDDVGGSGGRGRRGRLGSGGTKSHDDKY